MERDVDRHESNRKDLLPLGEGDLGLVKAGRSLDSSKSACKTVKSLGGTGDNKVSRSVVQRHVELRVRRQERVGLANVLFQVFELESVDAQHVGRNTFVVLDGVLDELGLEREDREEFLSSETNVEEELKSLERVAVKRVV